jgi:hypothetical protein
MISALIVNLVFSWSNNESLLIYILMLLLKTDDVSATVVFGTLNTTRARLDMISRLAKLNIKNREVDARLAKIIERFNAYTRIRNEFNHCIYTVDPQGVITHTQSIRIAEVRGQLQLGSVKPMDQIRIKEIMATVQQLKELNREIWVSCLFLRLTCARSNARPTRISRSRPRRAIGRSCGARGAQAPSKATSYSRGPAGILRS